MRVMMIPMLAMFALGGLLSTNAAALELRMMVAIDQGQSLDIVIISPDLADLDLAAVRLPAFVVGVSAHRNLKTLGPLPAMGTGILPSFSARQRFGGAGIGKWGKRA